MFFVYILQCSDNSFYTGYTNDIDKRLRTHNEGKASKYTRTRLPVKIVYVEEFVTKSEAMKREIEIKKLTRAQKEQLVQTSPNRICP
ncbi:MAG: GIY-YIG nuclease family protein [Syntrophomonadaceae bacterium]|nr:GIY-YIG nuclease family protein [Syntrophomonadaceae bacterium]